MTVFADAKCFRRTSSAPAASVPTSGNIFVTDSSNATYQRYLGFIDPLNDHGHGIYFQFTPDYTQGTVFNIPPDSPLSASVITGYKSQWYTYNTFNGGTEVLDSVMHASSYVIEQNNGGFCPVQRPDHSGAAFNLSCAEKDYNRQVVQLCHPKGLKLNIPEWPVLVVANKLYPDCANVSLALVPPEQ